MTSPSSSPRPRHDRAHRPAARTHPPPPAAMVSGLQVLRRYVEPDLVELVLHGELDLATFPVAQRGVGAAQHEGPAVLVLNLAELTFLDSSGIRLVLLAQQAAVDSGRKVAVRLGRGQARRVFDMLGLTDRLDVLDDHRDIDAVPDTHQSPDGTADTRAQG